jgi:hypothetical protein
MFFLTRTGASFGELEILKAHHVEEAPPFSMAEPRKGSRGRNIATSFIWMRKISCMIILIAFSIDGKFSST